MTEGFYDIHCHILPAVDDGAENLDMAIGMLKISRDEGIRHVILTPHFHVGHYEHHPAVFQERFHILKERSARELPDMKLYLGCEICCHLDAAEKLEQGELLTMAGSQYVLIEFFPRSELRTIENGLKEIQMTGKQPILAHIERYKELTGNYDAVEKLIDMGVYIQVNSSAITGKEGFGTRQFAKKLLSYEMVHFIGTDAHGTEKRRPAMRECAEYIRKKWGEEYMEKLLIRNPEKIIRNQYL